MPCRLDSATGAGKGGSLRTRHRRRRPTLCSGRYPALGTPALWLALVIIGALIFAVALTVLRIGPINRTAGLLLLPYVACLVFASTLNLWAAVHN